MWSSPSYSDGNLYVGSYSWQIFAVNAESGAILWRHRTDWYVRSSFAVANGIVYTGSVDAKVYAVNATNGELLWTFVTMSGINAGTPVVTGDVVFAAANDGFLYALNAKSGRLLWKYDAGAPVYSSPAVSGGTIYVHSSDDAVHALASISSSTETQETPISEQTHTTEMKTTNGVVPSVSSIIALVLGVVVVISASLIGLRGTRQKRSDSLL